MPLVSGQSTVGTSSAVLFYSPPGSSVITINSGTISTSTTYLGFGAGTASTSGGYILDPGHTLTFATYSESPPSTVNAVSGAAATLSWIISTPQS